VLPTVEGKSHTSVAESRFPWLAGGRLKSVVESCGEEGSYVKYRVSNRCMKVAFQQRSIKPPRHRKKKHEFDAHAFLNSAGIARKITEYRKSQKVYCQGDPAATVLYIQEGRLKLSVVSGVGREAVVALLGPGDFCGEGCLTGLPFRMESATTISPTTLLVIEKSEMVRVLHEEHKLSDSFIAYLLTRNIRVEEDLIDQLFNSIEKRLARTLLLLARFGKHDPPHTKLPKLSQETLAEMIGTTRSRVSFFMNKFRRMGFIDYNGVLQVHDSLLGVVLHE
jgi:CRP/FNR family transcriptional regulator, cyclic AMP receptor protein